MDLIENDPLPADTLETAHDKITSIAQELQEQVDRSIKLSRTNTMTSTEFTVGSSDRANKILAFDGSGEISVTQELGTLLETGLHQLLTTLETLLKIHQQICLFVLQRIHHRVHNH